MFHATGGGRTVDAVLEIRASSGDGSINKAGRFQTILAGMESTLGCALPGRMHSSLRGEEGTRRSLLSGENVAQCVTCHIEHGAVERTFGQFYPTILDAARRMGTLKPGF